MDPLRPGQDPERIGDHVLLGRLGAGGMGRVYLARTPDGRNIAVKVIHEEIVGNREALARFRREVATVRTVRSPHTARLVDASLHEAPYWLATEHIPGPTLRHAVGTRGPFPAAECRALFAALAEALTDVHAYEVTHRDLKPHNVILSDTGPRLIDFGIARGADDTALTRTGAAPGTPGFTAPEVLLRNQVSPAADVFALGATLAYALTGRPPFGDGPAEAVSYRAVHEDIDLPDPAAPETGDAPDADLIALIRACVAKDPARRPHLAEVIARCGRPEGAPLPPTLVDEPASTAPTPPRRRPPWAALAAALALAAAAGTAAWQGWGDDAGPGRGSVTGGAHGAAPGTSSPPERTRDPAKPTASAPEIRWTVSDDPKKAAMGIGDCDRPADGGASGTTTSTRVSYLAGAPSADVEAEASGGGPYRLVFGVKPPGTKGVGFTSAPVRLASTARGLTYPKDFAKAPEVTSAPGDWTVVAYLAENEDRSSWKVFGCTGFHASRRQG
ncbi:protein kinase [Streptomyces sp. NPDC047434]|uniref:serine/threonine-protein kinase n=1 Tax=Streptomyces sp. NPDC047434 TaxID=3155143 RepID=UPI0033E80E32